MKKLNEAKKVDAFRLLKSLKRGDEIWVNTNGKEERMFVVGELELSRTSDFALLNLPAWEYANIHVSPGLGNQRASITVQQQVWQEAGMPFVIRKVNEKKVRMVEVGPDLYKRLDEIGEKYVNAAAYKSAVKNLLSKKAVEVPEDILV